MKPLLIAAAALIVWNNSQAQGKIAFASQNYMGVLSGADGSQPELQTINGIGTHKWFAGAGVSTNWYYRHTMPVFGYGEFGLPLKKNKNIYISAGAGPDFPLGGGKGVLMDANIRYKPGLYWQTGVGYKINVGKKGDAILLHAGLMNKSFREIITSTYPCIFGPCPTSPDIYTYKLHALSVRIGYGF